MIQFGNDKIGEIYYGSDKIKEVYYGSELVWKGGGLVLFEANKINVGFEMHRLFGSWRTVNHYIGSDKIELSYQDIGSTNTGVIVGLIDTIDVSQFSNLSIKYKIIMPSGYPSHISVVLCGASRLKTVAIPRQYNAKEYSYVDNGEITFDSMLIDLNDFEYTDGGPVVHDSCYIFIGLQMVNQLWGVNNPVKLEVTKIELI